MRTIDDDNGNSGPRYNTPQENPVKIGDRYHPRPNTSSVVIVRFVHPNGTVLVEAETPRRSAHPYLVRPETLVPVTN